MKNFIVVAMVVVFGSAVSAFASQGSYINLPGLSFGSDVYEQYDGRTTFSSSLASLDQISGSWVSLSKNTDDPNRGYITVNFNGTVFAPVTKKEWQSNTMSLNYRGLDIDINSSIGAYQDIVGWTGDKDGQPIFGNWMSNASGSVTTNGVSLIRSTGGYNEFTCDSDNGKVDRFYAYAQFEVAFESASAAEVFGSMSSPSMMSAVPEPATMTLLGLGALGLLRRRWKK